MAVPGWREDPTQRHAYRYHDGANWTIYVADANAAGTDDPYPGQTPPAFSVGPAIAGWWPDPWKLHRARYHDGNQWTTTVNDAEPGDGTGPHSGEPVPIRDGLSPAALALAVLASVVGTVLIAKLGKSQGATLAGAAVSPMIAALFTTRRKGLVGRLRAGAVGLLTLAAVGFTVLGFTATETATGKSLINDDQTTTFPLPERSTTTNNGTSTEDGIDTDGGGDTTSIEVTLNGEVVSSDEVVVPICPEAQPIDLTADVISTDPEIDEADVAWTSSDTSVASVDEVNGIVTAVAEAGSADITAGIDQDTLAVVEVEVDCEEAALSS